MSHPDPVDLAVAHLAPILDAPVSAWDECRWQWPCVTVTHISSTPVDPEVADGGDVAQLQIDCFAPTRDEAWTLAHEARTAVLGMADSTADGAVVTDAASTVAPFPSPDRNRPTYRVLQQVAITFYPFGGS